MNLKEVIRPITYLKTNAADVLNTVSQSHSPMIITHNGEAKMVVQDIDSYTKLNESLTMLKIVAMSKEQIDQGKLRDAETVFSKIDKKLGI